jgi:hypothetical protein
MLKLFKYSLMKQIDKYDENRIKKQALELANTMKNSYNYFI